MTRKNKRKSNRRTNNRRSAIDMVTLPARALLTGNTGAAGIAISLQPTNLNSVAQAADNYEFYRITRLRYRLYPNGGGSIQTAAYIAGAVDNPPTTFQDMAQTPHCVIYGDDVSVPTAWRRVPRTALISYNSWYKTVAGSPDPSEEIQGQIYIVSGNASENYIIEIEATYQFRTLVVTSATPAERGAIELEKYRANLLRIMGLSPVAAALPTGSPSVGKQK